MNNQVDLLELINYDDLEWIDMSLDMLILDNLNKFYDMIELVFKIFDEGDFYEI